MSEQNQFTSRRRTRKTRWSVRFSDTLARSLISAGGIGTIVAVCGICFYLLWVTIPLFQPADIRNTADRSTAWESRRPLEVAIDEFRVMGWALFPDGTLDVFRADTGQPVRSLKLFDEAKLTATSFSLSSSDALFAFEDGTVRLGEIGFETEFLNPDDITARIEQIRNSGNGTDDEKEKQALDKLEEVATLKEGETTLFEEGVVQRTTEGQFRITKFHHQLEEPLKAASSPIDLIDHLILRNDLGITGAVFVLYSRDGKAEAHVVEVTEDLLTLEKTFEVKESHGIPFESRDSAPAHLLLSGLGDKIYLGWEDGMLQRFDSRGNFRDVRLAETIDLVPGEAKLTHLEFLLGRTTLVAGDTSGRVIGCFPVRPETTDAPDGQELRIAHELPGRNAPVTSLGMSRLTRVVGVGYADGAARIFYMTTRNLLAEFDIDPGNPVTSMILTPKDDGVCAVTPSKFWRADYDPKHPEVTLSSVFLPVWYEGYAQPETIWQSGGGSESLETKLSLWPLIYGTIKATFYSMLLGAPLALLGAIFTSEFLHPAVKARVKPSIEIMASLPSVVLGFMAALVFAPVIDKVLPGTLACFFTVPFTLLLGAHLWQMVPHTTALRWYRLRFALMFLAVPIGVMAGLLLGPTVESWFFAGNIVRWLDGQIGSGIGAWMFLFLPLAALVTAVGFSTLLTPWMRRRFAHMNRGQFAELNFLKFLAGTGIAFGLALLISAVLNSFGFDPRGHSQSYVGTYDQRNSLVVGFVMGFAIIPIIYTLSEDALSTVPEHLRSASLAAGATPWQTAVRIVIPTAMSGLFSALMIGLGRAVGETMIVLMATGSTPVKEWNIFNGFRTLSANIAIELPEAAKNTTHFRTLFLAALSLFVMTFCINTVAEMVRLRFRKRAYQL